MKLVWQIVMGLVLIETGKILGTNDWSISSWQYWAVFMGGWTLFCAALHYYVKATYIDMKRGTIDLSDLSDKTIDEFTDALNTELKRQRGPE